MGDRRGRSNWLTRAEWGVCGAATLAATSPSKPVLDRMIKTLTSGNRLWNEKLCAGVCGALRLVVVVPKSGRYGGWV